MVELSIDIYIRIEQIIFTQKYFDFKIIPNIVRDNIYWKAAGGDYGHLKITST